MSKYFLILFIVLSLINYNYAEENKIYIDKIDKTKLQKLVKERKGKILFLNIWATWCTPCREEFPSIIKLSSEFKDVEFIGITVDFPDEIETKIKPFLKKYNVTFQNYVNVFNSDEELINTLNEKWNGALPATFIFDKKGKQIFFLEEKKSYEEFKNYIEKARR